MADDLFSEAAQLGGVLPGLGAIAFCLTLALRLGRHIGVYDKTQESQSEENKRVDKALGKLAADLDDHKQKTDLRLASHAETLTETRLALARLPDREELRAWFADMRAAIDRQTP